MPNLHFRMKFVSSLETLAGEEKKNGALSATAQIETDECKWKGWKKKKEIGQLCWGLEIIMQMREREN